MTMTWTLVAFAMAWVADNRFSIVEATGARVLATLAGAGIALLAVFLAQQVVPPDGTTRHHGRVRDRSAGDL